MTEKIQITREDALELAELSVYDPKDTVKIWTNKGLIIIKKSALEQARGSKLTLFTHNCNKGEYTFYLDQEVEKKIILYERAIKELWDKRS